MSLPLWKRIVLALAVVITALVALSVSAVVYFLFVPSHEDYSHRISLDSAVWQAPPKEEDPAWPIRLQMADSLVASKSLDGLSRLEVESLLGKADVTDKWRNWDLVYWLGPDRGGFRIDSEWLVVKFDAHDRVVTYRIVSD